MDYQLHYSPLLYQLSYQGMDEAMVNFTNLKVTISVCLLISEVYQNTLPSKVCYGKVKVFLPVAL